MPLNKESIWPLLRDLLDSDLVTRKKLTAYQLDEAQFEKPLPGYTIWKWGPSEAGGRGELTLLFKDSDGTNVFLSIMADKKKFIREIELWRGDGKDIERLPPVSELIEMEAGKIY